MIEGVNFLNASCFYDGGFLTHNRMRLSVRAELSKFFLWS